MELGLLIAIMIANIVSNTGFVFIAYLCYQAIVRINKKQEADVELAILLFVLFYSVIFKAAEICLTAKCQ